MKYLTRTIKAIHNELEQLQSEDTDPIKSRKDIFDIRLRIESIITALASRNAMASIGLSDRLKYIEFFPPYGVTGKTYKDEYWKRGKKNLISLLDDMENLLGENTKEEMVLNKSAKTNLIFIVHGHDEKMKMNVQNFLEGDLKLETIILHQNPNIGRTIIEKFEDYSNVKYAVVLFSPDDHLIKFEDIKNQERAFFRIRQNVVLELGFFLGKLGRKNVCVLLKEPNNSEKYDKPSDHEGILYIQYNENNQWKSDLIKELKAIGLY